MSVRTRSRDAPRAATERSDTRAEGEGKSVHVEHRVTSAYIDLQLWRNDQDDLKFLQSVSHQGNVRDTPDEYTVSTPRLSVWLLH